MESEIATGSTRNQIRKKDLPLDLPALATSYVRQNNDLRKTLDRFEQERQKKMRNINQDIWELQRFLQDLKCVTTFSAENILSRQKKPPECSLDRSLPLSKNLQDGQHTVSNTNGVFCASPVVSIIRQKTEGTEKLQASFSPSRNQRALTYILNQQHKTDDWSRRNRRRSSSAGEMSSGTLKHLNSLAQNNQPLLRRRRSLEAGKVTMKIPYTHEAFKGSINDHEHVLEPFDSQTIGEDEINRDITEQRSKLPDIDKEVEISANETSNFENNKLNVGNKERKRPVLCQRPPSVVMEEEGIENVSERVKFFVALESSYSRSKTPSSSMIDIPKKNDDSRFLARKSKFLPLQLDHPYDSSKAEDKIVPRSTNIKTGYSYQSENEVQRKAYRKGIYYKETTSSLLRKRNQLEIGLKAKEENKSIQGFVSKELGAKRGMKSGS